MDKKIYKMLNESKIDTELEADIDELELERIKKRVRESSLKSRRKSIHKGLALVLALVLLASPPARMAYGKVRDFFQSISSSAIDRDLVEEYLTNLNLVSSSNGVDISLREVFLDNDRIYLNFLSEIKDRELLEKLMIDDNYAPEIKVMPLYELEGLEQKFGDYREVLKFRKAEDYNKFQFILEIGLGEMEESSNQRLIISELIIRNARGKEISLDGDWTFDLQEIISGSRLEEKVYNINQKLELKDGRKIIVESIRTNGLEAEIKISRGPGLEKMPNLYLLEKSPKRGFTSSKSINDQELILKYWPGEDSFIYGEKTSIFQIILMKGDSNLPDISFELGL